MIKLKNILNEIQIEKKYIITPKGEQEALINKPNHITSGSYENFVLIKVGFLDEEGRKIINKKLFFNDMLKYYKKFNHEFSPNEKSLSTIIDKLKKI